MLTLLFVHQQLQLSARKCTWLILWLDCDREGEGIAAEVVEHCQAVNKNIRVFRAHFSALIERDLFKAVGQLGRIDYKMADAVNARTEIDLRLGAVFTRWMTLRLQNAFPALSDHMISYGPCQFPTLGFVVARCLRIEKFGPEAFWFIKLEAQKADASQQAGFGTVSFRWKRGHVFDRLAATILYELCAEAPLARITKVQGNPQSKVRPVPLATVEMQKRAASWLRIASEEVMKTAEALYQRGIVSYPRTETEAFKEGTDLNHLIELQRAHPAWGGYAAGLLQGGGSNSFLWPRAGNGDDQAHPPIHPTQCVEPGRLQNDHERKVYEFICRHFLACCSRDAQGFRTNAEATVAGEVFAADGLMILERNYLEVYTYDRWAVKTMPEFQLGEEFSPTVLSLEQGVTTAPALLSERDLIDQMDKAGIGTDATIAEHIKKVRVVVGLLCWGALVGVLIVWFGHHGNTRQRQRRRGRGRDRQD